MILTATCIEAKSTNSEKHFEKRSVVQVESGRIYIEPNIGSGMVFTMIAQYLYRFYLGFLVEPVLVGILHLWDRNRKPLQYYLFNLSPSMYLFNLI